MTESLADAYTIGNKNMNDYECHKTQILLEMLQKILVLSCQEMQALVLRSKRAYNYRKNKKKWLENVVFETNYAQYRRTTLGIEFGVGPEREINW